MQLASSRLAVICLMWLMMVSARPGSQQRHRTLVSPIGEEQSTDGRIGVVADGDRRPAALVPQRRPPRDTVTNTQARTNRVWHRFFNDFLNNQKTFRGRTKKGASGCFGMKMDRIGSMSSLGC